MADDGLMREVDEDMRRERMHRLWMQYRKPLLIMVAVLVIGMTAATLWQDYQSKKAGEAMAALNAGMDLMQKKQPAEAAQAFAKLAENSGAEVRDIARLWQGRALMAADKKDEAVKSWNALASSPAGADLLWRDMACLRLMSVGAEVPKACTSASDSPLEAQRVEWEAARLWQEGKTDEARALLTPLSTDTSAPQSQRERATRLLSALEAGAK